MNKSKISVRSLEITLSIFMLLTMSIAALAHKDRLEHAQHSTVTCDFENGRETIVFTFVGTSISSLEVRFGNRTYVCPASECAKFHDVHFETVNLLWNGSQENFENATYFYVQFYMGSEKERSYGELPYVQTFFRGGQFDESIIWKKIDKKSTWQFSKM